ncbi:MAG: DUF3365 domain-containing protein [Gammaproteobacteria bacterium]|nr:DUF3365 domain-containing protein [Gammaproteobacteria bacterium]
MRRYFLVLISTMLLISTVHANQVNVHKKKAMPAIKEFAGKLKGEMKSAMKSGGPVAAIQVCSDKAPGIAQAVGSKYQIKIARTSLKLRNPENAPDAWEQNVLTQFEERKKKGEDVKKMAYADIVDMDGKKVFRMMKAIPTGQVCLKCHADKINSKVEAKLKSLYPTDKARGFKLGDIRGAITIIKELN